jgi:type III pantothenate kinase
MKPDYALCIDVGNSQIYSGVFDAEGNIGVRFRKVMSKDTSADEYGIFLKSVLRENGFDPEKISHIALCSVVPETVYSIHRACQKYFGMDPFILKAGVKTGLQITYRNPLEVGADRIADAIAAIHRYPDSDCIIVDFGTATTFEAVTADRRYLGGAIAPGLKIGMQALEQRTARLSSVEIISPAVVCGRSTTESIQSARYYGHLGMIREIVGRMTQECFGSKRPVVLATGGFSHLFSDAGVFDAVLPDLVLEGLYHALLLNWE